MPKGKEQGMVNKQGVSDAAKVMLKTKAKKATAKASPVVKSKAKPKAKLNAHAKVEPKPTSSGKLSESKRNKLQHMSSLHQKEATLLSQAPPAVLGYCSSAQDMAEAVGEKRIRAELQSILFGADLEVLKFGTLRSDLEKRLGLSSGALESRKDEVKTILHDVVCFELTRRREEGVEDSQPAEKKQKKTTQPAASCQASSSQCKRKHSIVKGGGDSLQQKKHQDDGSTKKLQKTSAHKQTSCESVDLGKSVSQLLLEDGLEDESNECINVGNGATEKVCGNEESMGLKLTASHQETLEADGFVLLPVVEEGATQEWTALAKLLVTESSLLGHGRDVSQRSASYNGVQLVRAWRVHHVEGWRKYKTGVATVETQMDRLAAKGKVRRVGLPVKTAEAAAELPLKFSERANEQLLLHGTQPDMVMSLLSMGLNERFSGTNAGNIFGDGIFLAEDVGKTDQYVKIDAKRNPKCDLHRRLYDRNHCHPGSVYYVLAVRAALGQSIRTKNGGQDARSVDTGEKVFPKSFRELAPVPDVSPPLFHHSLIAELGESIRRYREFVVFHGEYVYPEYLLAYQRLDGREPIQAKCRQQPSSSTSTVTAVTSQPPNSSSHSATAAASAVLPPKPRPLRMPVLPKSSTACIDIDVPCASVGQVKALGAQYDVVRKTWYIPPYQDLMPFEQWIGYHSIRQAENNPHLGPIQPSPRLQIAATTSGAAAAVTAHPHDSVSQASKVSGLSDVGNMIAVSPLMPPVSPLVSPPVSPLVSPPVSILASSPISPPVAPPMSPTVLPPVSPPVSLADLKRPPLADVILDCPFDDKDEVKALGARFDWENKVWYVPMGMYGHDLNLFKKWIPNFSASATTSAEQQASGLPSVSSEPVYLKSSFQDKDSVKALGARFDGQQRSWYVPPGKALAPFAKWISGASKKATVPRGSQAPATSSSLAPCIAAAVITSESTEMARASSQTAAEGMSVAQTAHPDTTAAGSVAVVSKTEAAAAAPSGKEDAPCGAQKLECLSSAADVPVIEMKPLNACSDAKIGDAAVELAASVQNKDTAKVTTTDNCSDAVSAASAVAAETVEVGPICAEAVADLATSSPVDAVEASVVGGGASLEVTEISNKVLSEAQSATSADTAASSFSRNDESAVFSVPTSTPAASAESSAHHVEAAAMPAELQVCGPFGLPVASSEPIYLTSYFHENHAVKALGARFDGQRRSWYVPPGTALAPFSRWIRPKHSDIARAAPLHSLATSTPAVPSVVSSMATWGTGKFTGAATSTCEAPATETAASGPTFLDPTAAGPSAVKATSTVPAAESGQECKAQEAHAFPRLSGVVQVAEQLDVAVGALVAPAHDSATNSEAATAAICSAAISLANARQIHEDPVVLPVTECVQKAVVSFASSPAVVAARSLELDLKSATTSSELQVPSLDLPRASYEPIYLTSSFSEKDTVKALGAHFDGLRRSWYVPPGRSLAPFAQWIRSKSSDIARAAPWKKSSDIARAAPFQSAATSTDATPHASVTPLQAAEAPEAIDPIAVAPVANTVVAETTASISVAVGQPSLVRESTGDQVDASSDEDELLIAAAIAVEERSVS